MRKKILFSALLLVAASLFILSCQKDSRQLLYQEDKTSPEVSNRKKSQSPAFNLNVNLSGNCKGQGHIKFRQDADAAKIIELDIKVYHLAPNHEYLLQRAVDAINVVDGNCTSTTWLTLGKGLVPQSILTDKHGKGSEALWRDVTAIPSGSTFDIHFRVIDAITSTVVLASDCYQYQVR
jgi:hypothetical protein